MSDELVKRLRKIDTAQIGWGYAKQAADRIEELEEQLSKALRSMTQVDEAFENWNKKQDEEAFIKLGAALVSNHETLAELTGGNKDDN